MNYQLRPWQKSDVNSLVKYANNWKIAQNLTNKFPHPYTKEAGLRFIEFATNSDPIHIFAIDMEGEACGGIGLHPQDDIFIKNAELGYWLGEPFWGRGIITQAVKDIVALGFQILDIDRIFARPFGSNIASQKVLEKAGFVLEGRFDKTIWKNGQYEDELVYAVRRITVKSKLK